MNGFTCDVCLKQRRAVAIVRGIAICRGCAMRLVRKIDKSRLKPAP